LIVVVDPLRADAASPVSLADGPPLAGKAVLAVEEGPTITHGGLPFGARRPEAARYSS